MNKPSAPSPQHNIPNPFPVDHDWDSHPVVEWLIARKKIILFAFLALIALLIFAARFATWRTLNAESDYFQAETAFTQYQKIATDKSKNEEAAADLEQLTAIMQRRPELKPKYEGPLAQTLLINGQIPQAENFIKDIFNRTKTDHLQLYQDYTKGSVLIGQGNYRQALENAEQLNAVFDQGMQTSNPILYAFNLIRQALLYQQTEQPQEELKAWQKLQQPGNSDALLTANAILRIGQADLVQYIEERISALAKPN